MKEILFCIIAENLNWQLKTVEKAYFVMNMGGTYYYITPLIIEHEPP